MFTPKYPKPDTAPAITTTTPAVPIPAPSAPVSNRPALQLTPGSTLTLVAGGGALVLVVGAVLVSMLLAVAITAASVAVCAVVVRSILKEHKA
ncbi:SpdD protein [Streptomyces sp. NPDC004539]|uniref:SpdD protein n=1 Tax=Streptomyces sp. NPDC004539 TaxID=3154280 RepID=UPI00339E55E4